MSNEINLTIKTPTKELFSGMVSKVVLPTMSGIITVLPGHANIITLIDVGIIEYGDTKDSHFLCIKGTARIAHNEVLILTEEAALPDKDKLEEIAAAVRAAQEGRPVSNLLAADLLRAEKELRAYLLKHKSI